MKFKTVKAPCKYYDKCGGCQLQHISNLDQKKYKENKLEDLFGDMGHVEDIISMEDPYNYRNKIHRTFKYDIKNNIITGMYEQGSHKLIDIDRCLIEDPIGSEIIKTIKSIMNKYKMEPYDEDRGVGFLRHVLIKTAFKTGEVMVVLVTSNNVFPGRKNFVKLLTKKHKEITSIIMNVNSKKTSMILSDSEYTLYGPSFIIDELCGVKFRISSKSFYQVNPIQTEHLYKKALELADLNEKDTLLDAYSGIGTIGLIASSKVEKVIGVEINKEAVKDSIKNAKINRIENVSYYNNDASEFMFNMARNNESIDVLIMDPPRKGSDDIFINAISKLLPARIIYISCNPETQKRDLYKLMDIGYNIKKIQPVDMFPQTKHIESIVSLKLDK